MKIVFILLIILLVILAVSYRYCVNPCISPEGEPLTLAEFASFAYSYKDKHPKMPNWLIAYILGVSLKDLEIAITTAVMMNELEKK